jgi:hypothetical protein
VNDDILITSLKKRFFRAHPGIRGVEGGENLFVYNRRE